MTKKEGEKARHQHKYYTEMLCEEYRKRGFPCPKRDYHPDKPRCESPPPCETAQQAPGRLRKNQRNLTDTERAAFRAAFESVIASGFLTQLVEYHSGPYEMHGSDRFLPWHRVFLKVLEDELRLANPSVTIPYWQWSADDAIPAWIQDWLPQVPRPGGAGVWQVTRIAGTGPLGAPGAGDVQDILSANDFDAFTRRLEGRDPIGSGAHNLVHGLVGGTMGAIATAPADPLFWMHHAEVDRVWAVWQVDHVGLNPPLSGSAAVMTPWDEVSEPATRRIEDMGYGYA